MRSSIAEDVLSLFTSREQAAAIVGDLLELSDARRRGWFTREVTRVAFALGARSLTAAPGRALGLAAVGVAVYVGIYAAVFIATGLPWYPWHRVFDTGFLVRVGAVVLVANFLTGAVLARRVRGGIRAIVPLTALWFAAWFLWPLLAWRLYPWPSSGSWGGAVAWPPFIQWPWAIIIGELIFPLLYLLPLLLGAVLAQRRAARLSLP